MNIIELSDKQYLKFKDLIYTEIGITLSDAKKALVNSRLQKRLRLLNLNSYEKYFDYLIQNFESEKINFINSLTTNKTDFFRESYHFEFLKEIVFPKWEKSNKNEFRIWSAGCSTGMEPYSIAITVQEYFFNKKQPNIKILATDIDTNVLDIAKEGIFKLEDIKNINVEVLKKYFYRGNGDNKGTFKVKSNLKKMISFRKLNLVDDIFPMKKKFDIIFCRNVAIYFNTETQQKIFKHFENFVDADSYLFIGHSENLSRLKSNFCLINKTVYNYMVD